MMVAMHRKVVIVTGANGGLGSSLVLHLLFAGYDVRTTFRSQRTELDVVLNQYRDFLKGDNDVDDSYTFKIADPVQVNLDDDSDVAAFARSVDGAPWGLINLAGASTNAMSWKMTSKQFERAFRDNLLSAFNICKTFVPVMRDAGWGGRIINISSVVAQTGVIGASHYAAAKAGLLGFTKSLALELAPKKITANAIALGYFNTGLITHVSEQMQQAIIAKTPVNRLGEPHDFNTLTEFLLSESSSFITGQTLNLNGGLM